MSASTVQSARQAITVPPVLRAISSALAVEPRLVAGGDDGDRAFGGEFLGDGAAQPAARRRHHGDLAAQSEIHASPPSTP